MCMYIFYIYVYIYIERERENNFDPIFGLSTRLEVEEEEKYRRLWKIVSATRGIGKSNRDTATVA